MQSTRKKIISTAIELFNQRGLGNVRIKEIADKAEISAGNLTYHFKQKKDLVESVYRYMRKSLEEISSSYQIFAGVGVIVELARDFLQFQIKFRFFYRDIMEIIELIPTMQEGYREQVEQIINFNRNGLYLLVGMGYIKPEPHQGLYEGLAKNSWAILNSWLIRHEILGSSVVDLAEGLRACMDLYFPYLTEEGQKFYFDVRDKLPSWLESQTSITLN